MSLLTQDFTHCFIRFFNLTLCAWLEVYVCMFACILLLSKLMLRRSQCEVKWAKGREIRKENWFLTFSCLIVYTHKPSSTILMISNEAVKFCYSLSRLSSTFRTCSRSLVITLYLKYFIIMSIIYLIRSHLFCDEIKEKFL